MTPKWLQKLREQQELIKALKRPENERRRPAAKFANKTMNRGPR